MLAGSAELVNDFELGLGDLGGPGESGQRLNFLVSNNNALFSAQPAV